MIPAGQGMCNCQLAVGHWRSALPQLQIANRKSQIAGGALLTLLLLATPLAAQTDLPDAIRSAEARQTQLRQQAAQVAAGLQTIIDEYRRNGLAGEDLKVLEAVRDVLGNLSARQMAQVIESLQQARAAGDTPAGRQALVGAVAGQKDIVVRLRQVLAEYQRRQALVELAQRLSALAQRQDANLRQVVELGRVLGGKTDLKDDQRISLSLQQAEQQAIRDEVLPLLARLAVTRSEAGAEVRQRLDAALAHATDSRLRALLDSALDALRQPALYRAAAEEKSIRDALRELSRLVMPPLDEATALRQALTDLDGLIARQNQLLADTRQPTARDQAAALEQSQARIVDEVDQARRDLATLAPQASATLASATTPMQEARAELQSKRPEPAAEKQVAALGVLQSAREQVARQLARAEQNPAAAPDRLAAARDAREQVKQLLEDQRQLGQDTAAERRADALPAMGTRQDALEQRARQALEQAGATSPPAAADLADAAGQMDRAAEALTKRQRQPAQDAQTAAVAALRRAEEQLARETRQLQQAQADLARANDARQQVADLLQEQRAMELDTNRRAQQPGTPTPPQAAADQRDLAARTAEVERRVPAAQQDAVAALDAARQRMDQAAADLAADRPDRAARPGRACRAAWPATGPAPDTRPAGLGRHAPAGRGASADRHQCAAATRRASPRRPSRPAAPPERHRPGPRAAEPGAWSTAVQPADRPGP
jgi:chromosome segregation protein